MVGLSGSMIKDTVKETANQLLYSLTQSHTLGPRSADLPSPESNEQPEATKVLVGVFFILFAQILLVSSEAKASSRSVYHDYRYVFVLSFFNYQ